MAWVVYQKTRGTKAKRRSAGELGMFVFDPATERYEMVECMEVARRSKTLDMVQTR